MALPVTITGISTAVAPVGPFKCTVGGTDAYYFFGRDGTTATTLQAYKAQFPYSVVYTIVAGQTNGLPFGHSNNLSRLYQTFTTGASDQSITSVTLRINKGGAPVDDMVVDIYLYDTGTGRPTGSPLGVSVVLPGTSISTSTGSVTFTFATPITVSPSTRYAVVASRNGAIDVNNFYRLYGSASDIDAAQGGGSYGTLSGWTATGTADRDLIVSGSASSDPVWSSIATKTGFTTAILNLGAYQVGNVIHMVVQDGTLSSSVATKYLSFDASINTFLASIETVAAAAAITGQSTSGWGASIVVRATSGFPVIFYNGLQTNTSGTPRARLYYRERTGLNTYSTQTQVDPNTATESTSPIAVLGASDRVHLLFFNGTNTMQRHLTSANVLGTAASTGATTAVQDACSYNDAGTIRHVGYTAAQTIRWASADNPTVTAASMVTGTPVRATDDGTTVYALYQNSADGDLYVKSSTDNGATFGSGTNVFTGTVAAAAANVSKNQLVYQRGSNVVVPYLVNDNSVLKYNESTVRTVITGTLFVNEVADTISAAGTVVEGGAAVTGTLNVTEVNDTIAAAATVTASGTLSVTEANDTISAAGGAVIGGALGVTEANDTLASAATVTVRGTLSQTEANDTLSSAATVRVGGTLNVTEASDILSATASSSLGGALSVTEANDTLSATGTVEAVATITGALNVTEVDDTVSAAGTVTVSGTLSVTEANDTLSAAATVSVTGALNVTEDNDTLSAAGIVSDGAVVTGELNVTEANDTISALATVAGEVEPPVFAGGGGYAEPPRPYPVEGVGYGILPPIEGEAHGVVSVGSAGVGLGLLPRFAGQATAAIGAAGSSRAQLEIRAAASGQAGAQARGFGMIMKLEGAAVGRQTDDDAAAVTFLLAA